MRRALAGLIVAGCVLSPGHSAAQSVALPANSALAAEDLAEPGQAALPQGPWTAQGIPMLEREGRVLRQAWRVANARVTTLQLLAPLRAQLEDEGVVITYECAAIACGGFDFRYALDLLPEPAMHVNLGDFRYLMAQSEDVAIAIVVSRSAAAGFVHITRVTTDAPTPDVAAPPRTEQPPSASPDDIAAQLDGVGHAALDDLAFETGSAALAEGRYPSLEALARYLRDNPEARLALVGHSDSVGNASRNQALSERRARAVRDRLIAEHGIGAGRLTSAGVGFLSPRASNATEDGRQRNRRVEAVRLPGP